MSYKDKANISYTVNPSGAVVHYTTAPYGSAPADPTASDPVFPSEVTVNDSVSYKFRAYRDGYAKSEVVLKDIEVLHLATPVISSSYISKGTLDKFDSATTNIIAALPFITNLGTRVTITFGSGEVPSRVYYTLDGSTPSTSSPYVSTSGSQATVDIYFDDVWSTSVTFKAMSWSSGYSILPSASDSVTVYTPSNYVHLSVNDSIEGFHNACKQSFHNAGYCVVGFFPFRPRAIVEGRFKLFPCNSDFTDTSSSWSHDGPLGYSTEGLSNYTAALAGHFDTNNLDSPSGKILYTNRDTVTATSHDDILIPAHVAHGDLGFSFSYNSSTQYYILSRSSDLNRSYPYTCFSFDSSTYSGSHPVQWTGLFKDTAPSSADDNQLYVYIPPTVTYLGNSTFYRTACNQIVFSQNSDNNCSIAYYGDYCFASSHIDDLYLGSWTKTLTIKGTSSVPVTIGEYVFSYNSFTGLVISGNVTGSNYSFVDHSGLITVDLSNWIVTDVPDYFMIGCFSVTSLTLPSSSVTTVHSFGRAAFADFAITSLTIPTCSIIGRQCFYVSPNLTEVKFPSNLTRIEDMAFYNCTSLSYVNFSACTSVPQIGTTTGPSGNHNVWTNCKLRKVYLPTSWWCSGPLRTGYVRNTPERSGGSAKQDLTAIGYVYCSAPFLYADMYNIGVFNTESSYKGSSRPDPYYNGSYYASYNTVDAINVGSFQGSRHLNYVVGYQRLYTYPVIDGVKQTSDYAADGQSGFFYRAYYELRGLYFAVEYYFRPQITFVPYGNGYGLIASASTNPAFDKAYYAYLAWVLLKCPCTPYGRLSTSRNSSGGVNISLGDPLYDTSSSTGQSAYNNLDGSAYCNALVYSDAASSWSSIYPSGVRLWDFLIPKL